MMEALLDIDQSLFLMINGEMSNSFFDLLLPWFREKIFWVPIYVFLLAFILFNFSRRNAILALLVIAASVGFSDTVSSKIIKPLVKRERPCNDIHFKPSVVLRVGCGGGKSFTSSHAANHFAFGTILFVILQGIFRWRWLFLAWAASVSFAQVYVGVHYPLDVLGGGLLGILIGVVFIRIYMAFKV